jgi:trans-AT polyketide synthase/acyltransferase/oxidoreductase domain-containing protein
MVGNDAVIGLNKEATRQVIASKGLHSIDIANLNSPSQIVISEPKNDVLNAQEVFKWAGSKMYMSLQVSGAFHSRLMEDSRKKLAAYLDQFSFSAMAIPVIFNVLARPYSPVEVRRLLADLMTHSVKWTESIRYLM